MTKELFTFTIGNKPLSFLPINISPGDDISLLIGVFLYSNKVQYISFFVFVCFCN